MKLEKISILIFFLSSLITPRFAFSHECGLLFDKNSDNFVVGYRSLMNSKSRLGTVQYSEDFYPIIIYDFKRSFGQRGNFYRTTFLTSFNRKNSFLNAIYFKVSQDDLNKIDKREAGYCRKKLDNSKIELLLKDENKSNKVFWIYASNTENVRPPSKDFPIVQSYVDLFLGGCFEVEIKYQIKDFAKQCVETTDNWTKSWLNDRTHPRRPFDIPFAVRIDNLLKEKISFYHTIKIE